MFQCKYEDVAKTVVRDRTRASRAQPLVLSGRCRGARLAWDGERAHALRVSEIKKEGCTSNVRSRGKERERGGDVEA